MLTSARIASGRTAFALSWPRWVLSLLAVVSLVLSARVAAAAYTPPPLDGPVNDPKGQLTSAEKQALVTKILGIKAARGYEIAVFLPSSLEGNTIEDVAYDTARAWKLGAQGKDDGVLLVIATKERKIRIETGKGVGGALPDLVCNRIIKEDIGPQLKANRVGAGVEAGVDAIDAELARDATGAPAPAKKAPPPASAGGVVAVLVVLLIMGAVGVLFLVLIVRAVMGLFGGGGRGYSNGYSVGNSSWSSGSDSSWSSGSDSSWSSGSDSSWSSGGSDFGGGGGDFGGGGSSGDY